MPSPGGMRALVVSMARAGAIAGDKSMEVTVIRAIRASDQLPLRATLRQAEKPIGCYLFSGPTGVGKTEVAKQLACVMGVELLRFDMSEYMERHTVSRLIGAPPGYVGFDQGGLLTDGVDQHPHCVLLLDEIEKAHGDLFNILLQVMDHGKLTDHNGKKIDFRNVVLIMTTNAGASDAAKDAIGFGRGKREGEDEEAIKKLFTPEFRNRLDAIIPFAPLSRTTIDHVVEKFVLELESQLADRDITFDLTPEATRWLGEKGYDDAFGARPLARVIQDNIKKPLADEILFGRLKSGGTVRVLLDREKDKLAFEIIPAAEAKARKPGPPKQRTCLMVPPTLSGGSPRSLGIFFRRDRCRVGVRIHGRGHPSPATRRECPAQRSESGLAVEPEGRVQLRRPEHHERQRGRAARPGDRRPMHLVGLVQVRVGQLAGREAVLGVHDEQAIAILTERDGAEAAFGSCRAVCTTVSSSPLAWCSPRSSRPRGPGTDRAAGGRGATHGGSATVRSVRLVTASDGS